MNIRKCIHIAMNILLLKMMQKGLNIKFIKCLVSFTFAWCKNCGFKITEGDNFQINVYIPSNLVLCWIMFICTFD